MSGENQNANNTGSSGAGNSTDVPENLKKYLKEDGSLDLEKASKGINEAESKMHEATTKLSESERALQYYASGGAANAGGNDDASSIGRYTDGDDAAGGADAGDDPNDAKATRDAVVAKQAVLEMIHPEIAVDPATGNFKDKEFADGLKSYIRTLPIENQRAIASQSFEATNWAIGQYKQLKKPTGNQTGSGQVVQPGGSGNPNFIEGASAGKAGDGKTWTHEEIKNLIATDEAAYAAKADEIQLAIQEGRVK